MTVGLGLTGRKSIKYRMFIDALTTICIWVWFDAKAHPVIRLLDFMKVW